MSEQYTEEELSMLSEEERAGLEAKEGEEINLDILKEVAGEEAAVTPPVEPEPVVEPAPEPPIVEPEPTPEPALKPEPPATYDFDAAEQKYIAAMQDGDNETALALRKEIRAEEAKLYKHQAQAETAETLAESKMKEDVARAAEEAYKKYPFLNHTAKEKNADAIEEVLALRNYYLTEKGMKVDAALRLAVEKVGPRYATPATPTVPTPTPARPDIKTLANVPVVDSNNPDNSKWAALDSLEGEAYESAVEKLSASEREEYLSR